MANKTDRGVTMTPISQYIQNNGLDEKEFFDFIKSKWGEEGSKGLTLSSEVPHGTLESFFDEYANEKFEKKAKEREPELIKEYAEKGITLTPKGEEPFTDKEYEDIYTAMYESGDPDYTDFYLKKYPDARGKDGFINYEHSSPELGKEYIKSHPELWEQTRKWLDTNKAIEEEPDELSAYTKDLEDYLEKNPKAKDKNYY